MRSSWRRFDSKRLTSSSPESQSDSRGIQLDCPRICVANSGNDSILGGMILLIDNYDSFTYNLVHYLGDLGAKVDVKRNDAILPAEALKYNAIIISPGPCDPDRAGICLDVVKQNQKTPLLISTKRHTKPTAMSRLAIALNAIKQYTMYPQPSSSTTKD